MPEEAPVVLLLEDDDDTREMYSLVLQGSGYRVIEAATAEQALDLLSREQPAAIVSDIALPGADGFEFCERVRRIEAYRTTPIIGLTAITLIQAMVQAKRAGFNEMLTKPCAPDELVAAIDAALRPPSDQFPKPKPVKAEDKPHTTPTERGGRFGARRFGDQSDNQGDS